MSKVGVAGGEGAWQDYSMVLRLKLAKLVHHEVGHIHEPFHTVCEAPLRSAVHDARHLVDTLIPAQVCELVHIGIEASPLTLCLQEHL